jgi:tetratricopeptide (TPR) repeat protein
VIANYRNSLGNARMNAGDYENALVELETASSIWRDALGPRHPDVAMSLSNIGNVYRLQGRFDEALELYGDARRIAVAGLPAGHPRIALVDGNMGRALHALGRHAEAVEAFDRALAVFAGPDQEARGEGLWLLEERGETLLEQGRADSALHDFREAFQLRMERFGAEHPETAKCLEAVARALAALGRLDEAREHRERAEAHHEQWVRRHGPSIEGVR